MYKDGIVKSLATQGSTVFNQLHLGETLKEVE